MRESKYTRDDLRKMQEWDFSHKIGVTQTRLQEFYQHNGGKIAINFSGGANSTVLLHLARKMFPAVESVYVNSGLDLPSVRKFALSRENITVLKPEMKASEIINNCGFVFPSKDVAAAVYYARKGSTWAVNAFNGLDKYGKPSPYKERVYKKWAFLVNAPFKISSRCCYYAKEKVLADYQRKTGNKPVVGTLASESKRREQAWLTTGCNSFEKGKEISKPMSFWTSSDTFRFLKEFNVPYSEAYGEIVEKSGVFTTTGEKRTGCCFCVTGVHLDSPNRFQILKETQPKLYKYCVDTLGIGAFLDYVGVDYI